MNCRLLFALPLIAVSVFAHAGSQPAVARCGFSEPPADVLLDFNRNELLIATPSETGVGIDRKKLSGVRIRFQRPSGEIHISKKIHGVRRRLLSIDPHLKGEDSMSEKIYEAAAAFEIPRRRDGGCDFLFDQCSLQSKGSNCLIRYNDGSFETGVCDTLNDSPQCVLR